MRKNKIVLLTTLLTLSGVITSCNNNNSTSNKEECNHVWSDYKVTAPTETATGLAERTCRLCDEKYTVTLPVLGDDSYTKTSDTADCVNDGVITYTYYNENDGRIRFDVRTNAKGHQYVLVEAVEATKTNIHGMKSYYKCENCDLIFDLEKNVLADTSSLITNYYESNIYYHWHGEEEKVTHNYKLNGPAINGVQTLLCENCDHIEEMLVPSSENVELSTYLKLAHMSFASEISTDTILGSGIVLTATKEKNNSFDGSTIKVGGKINLNSRHIKINLKSAATITIRVKTGKAENDTKIGYFADINNLVDDNGKVVGFTELSETKLSLTSFTDITFNIPSAGTYYFGSNDGGFYMNEIKVFYADGYHTLGNFESLNETQHGYKCTNDDCKMTFLANSHNYGTPTQNTKGEDVFVCLDCGYTYTDAWQKDADGHYKRGDETNKIAHTYDAWVIDKQPSYEAEGKEHHTCNICGYVEERNISMLNLGKVSEDADLKFEFDNEEVITSERKISEGILVVASSDKSVTLNANGYINLGGKANPNSRFIKIVADKAMKIKVQHSSNNKSETTLALFNEVPNEALNNYIDGQQGTATSTTSVYTMFEIPSAGTYYLGSLGGAIRVKAMSIETHAIDNTTWIKNENVHYHSGEGCFKHYDEATHEFDTGVAEGEFTKYTCTICGYEKLDSHTWETSYSTDDNYHWINCSDEGCNIKKDYGEHTYVADTTKTNTHPTDETNGSNYFVCSVCGKEKVENTPKIELGTASAGLITTKDVGTISWQEKLADGLLVGGTEGKPVVYKSEKLSWASSVATENQFDYDGYLYLGGAASGRYLKLNVSGKCTIKIYGTYSSYKKQPFIGVASTIEGITGGDTTDTTKFAQLTSANIQEKTFVVDTAGTYYIGSTTGGWNFVGLNITYAD